MWKPSKLMNTVRILLVDDHKLIRDAIKGYLAEDERFELMGEAVSGQEALSFLREHEVDIVFMDLNLAGMGGIEATREISKEFPELKILALTMMNESQHIKEMLKSGAAGYLLKNCGEVEIKNAIVAVMQGQNYYSPEVTQTVMSNLSGSISTQSAAPEILLSRREREVLDLILKEYSNKEIADELFISIRTVDAHKRNLLEKTGSRNVAGLVKWAVENQISNV